MRGFTEIAEAGGEVFDAAGEPLDFSRGRWLDLDTGIIATNKELKPVVLSAVQKCVKDLKIPAKHWAVLGLGHSYCLSIWDYHV